MILALAASALASLCRRYGVSPWAWSQVVVWRPQWVEAVPASQPAPTWLVLGRPSTPSVFHAWMVGP